MGRKEKLSNETTILSLSLIIGGYFIHEIGHIVVLRHYGFKTRLKVNFKLFALEVVSTPSLQQDNPIAKSVLISGFLFSILPFTLGTFFGFDGLNYLGIFTLTTILSFGTAIYDFKELFKIIRKKVKS